MICAVAVSLFSVAGCSSLVGGCAGGFSFEESANRTSQTTVAPTAVRTPAKSRFAAELYL
jgi:hypothetical protein